MRSRFTYADVCTMVAELRTLLLNDRLVNVYDVTPRAAMASCVTPPALASFLLKFQRAKTFCVLRPGQCVFADNAPSGDRRATPSSFCSKLRKHLRNLRVRAIDVVGVDRVVTVFTAQRS